MSREAWALAPWPPRGDGVGSWGSQHPFTPTPTAQNSGLNKLPVQDYLRL